MYIISKIYIILIILSLITFSTEKLIKNSQISTKFKVMSYNVRYNDDILRYNLDGSVKTRLPRIIKNIFKYNPDTIGFQEVTTHRWYPYLKNYLSPNYTSVGLGRESDFSGEAAPIFINTETLELIDNGTKWLSPTPDIPGSKFDDTFSHPTDGLPRVLTFAIVKNKNNNVTYMHINTHLDCLRGYTDNRISQVKVIMEFIKENIKKYSIILTGDFNSGNNEQYILDNDAVPFLVKNGFILSSDEAIDTDDHWTFVGIGYNKDIWDKCKIRGYHKNNKNFTEQNDCDEECDEENGVVYDYCMKPNDSLVNFTKYKVITDYSDLGGPSSDHYPIYVEGIIYNIIKNENEEEIDEKEEEENEESKEESKEENEENKEENNEENSEESNDERNEENKDDSKNANNNENDTESEVLVSIFIALGLIILMVIIGIIIFIKVVKKKDNDNEIKDNVNKIDNEKLVDNGE